MQLRERDSPLAYLRLFLVAEFAHIAIALGHEQYRAVRKASAKNRIGMLGDHTFDRRLGNMLAHLAAVVVNQGGRGTKPLAPPPPWPVLTPSNHLVPQRLIALVATL